MLRFDCFFQSAEDDVFFFFDLNLSPKSKKTLKPLQGWYSTLKKSVLTPPDSAFGPVWTVLYIMMGISSVQAFKAGARGLPLVLYGAQLAVREVSCFFFPALFLFVVFPFLFLCFFLSSFLGKGMKKRRIFDVAGAEAEATERKERSEIPSPHTSDDARSLKGKEEGLLLR